MSSVATALCRMKAAAIILAAGFSSRMGTDKALLPFGETTALELVVANYATAGVEQIVVVTGQNHAALEQLCLPVALVRNPAPENGMFSSIKLGTAQLEPELAAFFVHPVDTPLVRPETLQTMLNCIRQGEACSLIPCCDGKRGHPPLIGAALLDAILGHDGSGGLRKVLAGYTQHELDLADQGVLSGMNTVEEYQQLVRHCRRNV